MWFIMSSLNVNSEYMIHHIYVHFKPLYVSYNQ